VGADGPINPPAPTNEEHALSKMDDATVGTQFIASTNKLMEFGGVWIPLNKLMEFGGVWIPLNKLKEFGGAWIPLNKLMDAINWVPTVVTKA
jgi:hypothetical protein